MPRISPSRIRGYFQQADNATLMTAKGAILEDLVAYLFGRIPGVSVTERNRMTVFDTEEIDVTFWNDHHAQGLSSEEFPAIILVECKNWSQPVSSMEVAWFITKVWGRGQNFGILIAANGVTGNNHELSQSHQLLARALSNGIRILVITRAEIETITHSDDLVRLLKTKLVRLVLRQTSL
jgi:restriction endonuclease